MEPLESAAGHILEHTGDEAHFLRELFLAGQALLRVFPGKVGMPPARLALLRALAFGPPAGRGVMALSRELGVNAAAVTRQIALMDAKGLIEREYDPEDARRCRVKLSAKGLRAFKEFHERMHRFEEALVEGVDERDLTVATTVLAKIRAGVEAME